MKTEFETLNNNNPNEVRIIHSPERRFTNVEGKALGSVRKNPFETNPDEVFKKKPEVLGNQVEALTEREG